MKIAFFEVEKWEEKILSRDLPGEEISFSKDKIDDNNLPEEKDCEVLSVFVNSRITKKVLGRFPNLKLISTRSSGYDHIDLKACKERKVIVAHVPGYGANTVAEFAFGLMLNLTRKIYRGIDQIKEHGSFVLDGLRGIEIKGKVLGVVGVGRIGKQVVKIAQGFSMKVIAFDPFPDAKFQKEMGFKYVDLEEVLKKSDIVTLHAPYNKETHHLINKENIGLMKKGAILINTARGGLVETETIVNALKDGTLGGVGLDVLEEEGEVKDELDLLTRAHPKEEVLRNMLYNHILMEMPNVLITPHLAFNSQEAMEEILETTTTNIKGFIDDKPVNVVEK